MNRINERYGRSGRFSRSQLPVAGMLLLISCDLQAESIRGEVPRKVADIFLPNPEGVTVETWVQNLEIPWSLVFLPNGHALVSERPSRIQRIPSGQNKPQLYIKLDKAAHAGDGGLMGLALHPQFSKQAFVYAIYSYRKDGQLFNRVVRLRHQDKTGVFDRVVLDNIPGANVDIGGRITFGPDRMLYIGTGDLWNQPLSQDLQSWAGKILRITPDGQIPKDNPFPNSPVYSYGNRVVQGLAWDPDTWQSFQLRTWPLR